MRYMPVMPAGEICRAMAVVQAAIENVMIVSRPREDMYAPPLAMIGRY
jgi:hypothetical protein